MAPYAFPTPESAKRARPERPRLGATIALGAALAPGGTMVKIALAVMALTTLGALVTAVVLAMRGAGEALSQVAGAASTALAWGAGILVAVPASLQALRDDRRSGVRDLLRARGATTATYARGRVVGLALVLFAVVGGGTLVSGGAALLLATRGGVAARALGELAGSLLYAAAFAIVIAPTALAALGSRSRGGGYARLLAVLVVPELAEPWTSGLVPAGWGHMLSIPSALWALRASVVPPGMDGARLARAVVILACFAALAYVAFLAEIASLDASASREPERAWEPFA